MCPLSRTLRCYSRTHYMKCFKFSVNGIQHSCPILSNRFHPTKQHFICCRSKNFISDKWTKCCGFDRFVRFVKWNYRFDKLQVRSSIGIYISLVTTTTRCKIVESTDSFDWWEWLFHLRFHIKSLSNRRIHVNDD